jgi:hypothetical protein
MKAKVIRILEYEGEYEHLVKQLEQRTVKGQQTFGKVTIREAVFYTVDELLTNAEAINEHNEN